MKDLQQQGNKRDGVNQFNSNKLLSNPPTEVNMRALALEAHTGRSQVFTSFSLAGLVVLVICEELVFFFSYRCLSVGGRARKGEYSQMPVKKTNSNLSEMSLTLYLWL